MNYYELKKQATPGPFKVKNVSGAGIQIHGTPDNPDDRGYGDQPRIPLIVAYQPWESPFVGRDWKEMQMANARLFAHCRDNFDKALAELKGLEFQLRDDPDLKERMDTTRRVIAELETVEGI